MKGMFKSAWGWVKSGSGSQGATAVPMRPTARYLRDTRSGVIASRAAPLTSSRDDIRRSWVRSAGLAQDLIQNSGRLKGACDQVIADTVGVGLSLTPNPDLDGFEYSEEEKADFIRLIKRRWKAYWENKQEVDLRGKLTGPQMVDVGLRYSIAFGEITGVFDYFTRATRQRYGITTGTKYCLTPPSRLVQDTLQHENMFQGVRHDENGRPVAYRFKAGSGSAMGTKDFPAFDADGRPMVAHIFDPMDAEDVRGISSIAPAFRKHIQAEMLDDATLQMALLQTIFAITLTSDAPSKDAFEGLEAIDEIAKEHGGKDGPGFSQDYINYMAANLEAAADSRISVGSDPQVSHLGPGERLGLETAKVPGQDFLPFSNSLSRDMARTIGITFGGLTMDHTDASYASTRMEMSSIWPVVMRRRERLAAPQCQMVYANWLDEEVGEGRIPFKGGYEAFRKRRSQISIASWQGPAKPNADDYKAAKASSERLRNGTSSIEDETGDMGIDADTLFERKKRLHDLYVGSGMRSPYAADEQSQTMEVETIE